MSIFVGVVLLFVAAVVCAYAAWFFVHIAYRVLLEKALRAITGRRKPDYARIGELEASDPRLPMPERLAARRKAAKGVEYGAFRQPEGFTAFRPGVERIWTDEDTARGIDEGVLTRIACASCGLYLKPCPQPDCVREPPWVHLDNSHCCPYPDLGVVALAAPGLFLSADGGWTWTLRGPVRDS